MEALFLGEHNEALLVWQPLFQCSVIMRGGLAHVFFQPGLSGPELACMWASFLCCDRHSRFFIYSTHHCSLHVCIDSGALPLIYSMVFCAGFPLPLSWLLDMSLFMSASFWFWREMVYGRDLYFLTCRALYMYCVWSLIEVFGLHFEWFSVDVKKVSKVFCTHLWMCMCVMVCSAQCLSSQGPLWQIYWCDRNWTEHIFYTLPHQA